MPAAVLLPDRTTFPFWQDTTAYRKTYHVAQRHPRASDQNPGTAEAPFATISRAAALAQPGERVLVQPGLYRECVSPARGGIGPDGMILYEAAPAADGPVVIRASEPFAPTWSPGSDWSLPGNLAELPVFVAQIPLELFRDGFNPFQCPIMAFMPWFPWHRRPVEEIRRTLLTRGGLFQDGRPLTQVPDAAQLASSPGTFFVGADGTRLFVRFHNDTTPEKAALEITTRGQCFAPRTVGLGYIRVKGFTLEHAANPLPMPHRGALSTSAGHHWIIEHNTVRHATCLGIDIGHQRDIQPKTLKSNSGGHIVRRNTVADCGAAGIAGTGGMEHCLIEENLFERIGGINLEHAYENAAIKFHFAKGTLIRRNIIRHLTDACGIWLDWMCGNNRVSENVIADVQTLLAGIYIEANLEPHLVDRNLIWNLRDVPTNNPPKDDFPGGNGISVDVSDFTTLERNLIGQVSGHYGIAVHLCQKGRLIGGTRAALLRDSKVLDNVLVDCPKRIYLARTDTLKVDGNVYDTPPDAASFAIEDPTRPAKFDLHAWQNYFGFDQHGGQARIEGTFDPDPLVLTLKITPPVPAGLDAGPLSPPTWQKLLAGETVTVNMAPREDGNG